MNQELRDKALRVLKDAASHSPTEVHNAVVDLRRNGKSGDEPLLQQALDFPDEMVASAALFALIHVYESPPDILDILMRCADGDSRDTGEMPIQTQAVEGLAVHGRRNPTAVAKLIKVAKCESTPEAPRARAWKCLAELFGVPWVREYSDAMIWDPQSVKSEAIRELVLESIAERAGVPCPEEGP